METSSNCRFQYYFKKPEELPDTYFDSIVSLVKAGGSVNHTWVSHHLKNAFLIGYVLYNNKIVGCSALKHPRPEFIKMVREKAGLDLTGFLERGYTSVLPEFRGRFLASSLLSGLTSRAGEKRIYSIIGEDNIGGHKIAINNKTRKVAVYQSSMSGKHFGIWMPEQMIEPDIFIR
ncbi:MAG: hypothetical protein R6U68_10545 [Desulfobacteraceae bacterium]